MITSLLLTFRLLEYHNATFNIIQYAMKTAQDLHYKLYRIQTNTKKIMKVYSHGSSSLTPCPWMGLCSFLNPRSATSNIH